ncbi:MAG: alpha/beta hydrolase [Parvularculales bacterium]
MTDITFNGPVGRLEGHYHHGGPKHTPTALILHPHPQFGGTMNNLVVRQLFHLFVERGFSVLRFNFRGVGRSQGEHDSGAGELSDATTALDWLQDNNLESPQCWVAGFSFGAWIGMQLLMRRPEIASFISIAPPVNMYDFSFLAPCPSSGLVLHGSSDQVVPQEDMENMVNHLRNQKNIEISHKLIRGANHFFDNHIDSLAKTVSKYLDDNLMIEETEAA